MRPIFNVDDLQKNKNQPVGWFLFFFVYICICVTLHVLHTEIAGTH